MSMCFLRGKGGGVSSIFVAVRYMNEATLLDLNKKTVLRI